MVRVIIKPHEYPKLVAKSLKEKGYLAIIVRKKTSLTLLSTNASRHQVYMIIDSIKHSQMSKDEWIADTRLECA